MKKILVLMMGVFSGAVQAQRIAITPPKPVAADKVVAQLNQAVKKALDLAENNPDAGCAQIEALGKSIGGVQGVLLSEENKKIAAALCCDKFKEDGYDTEHPKAYHSVCGTPKPLKEYLGDAVKFTIEQPAVRCPAAAKLGTHVAKLPKEEREKLCKACGSRWPQDSKAKFAVCGMQGEELPKGMKLEDLDFPEEDEGYESGAEEEMMDLR